MWRSRGCWRVGAVLLVLALTPAARAQNFAPWSPGGSGTGDPRLDQTVSLWKAGITVAEVLEAAHAQTGVSIRPSSSDGLENRLRVTVYLNPQNPPRLGELLAQLAWVTDGTVRVAGTGREAVYQFVLPPPGTGDPVAKLTERLDRESRERQSREWRARRGSRSGLAAGDGRAAAGTEGGPRPEQRAGSVALCTRRSDLADAARSGSPSAGAVRGFFAGRRANAAGGHSGLP